MGRGWSLSATAATSSTSGSTGRARSRLRCSCGPSASAATPRSCRRLWRPSPSSTPWRRTTPRPEAEALIEIYKRLRPGEPPTEESARSLFETLFYDPKRYDLAAVGRYKINKKLRLMPPHRRPGRWSSRSLIRRAARSSPRPAPASTGSWPSASRRRECSGSSSRAATSRRCWWSATAARRRRKTLTPGRHRRDHQLSRRPDGGRRLRRRHRPPGQPPAEVRRRTAAKPVPHRAFPDGAGRAGAHDDPGHGHHHAPGADQHPPGGRRDQGVFRQLPAVAVHGPDQPAGRADPQAAAFGPGPGRALPRAGRHGSARRPPQPLRAHVPHRDAGRAQHRPHRLACAPTPGSTSTGLSRPRTARWRTAWSPTRSST